MLVLRFGLYLAAGSTLFTAWASRSAGYPVEVAILRGLLAFMAISLLLYLGAIVIATAPAPSREASAPASRRHQSNVHEPEEAAPDAAASESIRRQRGSDGPAGRRAA